MREKNWNLRASIKTHIHLIDSSYQKNKKVSFLLMIYGPNLKYTCMYCRLDVPTLLGKIENLNSSAKSWFAYLPIIFLCVSFIIQDSKSIFLLSIFSSEFSMKKIITNSYPDPNHVPKSSGPWPVWACLPQSGPGLGLIFV